MKCRINFISALLTVLMSALASAGEPGLRKPNILWLIAEDSGPGFGCYGHPAVRTPNIDRLAGESRLYRNALSTASVCSVSRSAFMTGVFQTRIGASNHRSHRTQEHRLPDGVKVLTERLREAGYFTVNVRELPAELKFNGTGKTDWNFFETGKEFDTKKWSDLKSHESFYAQINFTESHRV